MTFWELTVPTSPDTSDGLTNFLWEHGALGVVEEESPREPARLRAFFPESATTEDLLRAVTDYRTSLLSLGFAVSPAPPRVAPLKDAAWADAWKQSFPPRAVGQRLLVIPPWEESVAAAHAPRRPIVIEPGRAFGTGHHGSTEGCLVLLEEALAAEGACPPVLDVGTGSGILAIAAVALGAPRVLAIDVDPDAIASAGHNAERNGCADRIALRLDDAGALSEPEPFALVVANLLTQAHLGLASRYASLVAPGGRIILGGILAADADTVARALEAAGFEVETRLIIDEWASLLLRRPLA